MKLSPVHDLVWLTGEKKNKTHLAEQAVLFSSHRKICQNVFRKVQIKAYADMLLPPHRS